VLPLQYGQSYRWKVRASLNGCSASESTVQQFTLRNLPDLIVTEISVPDTAYSEAPLAYRYKIKNNGLGTTGSIRWYDQVNLSEFSQLLLGTDYDAGRFINFEALAPGQTYETPEMTYMVPQGVSGIHYLHLSADTLRNILETNETNNKKVSVPVYIKLSPPPDLQVTALAVNPGTAFSEDSLTVNWTVTNKGIGPTTTGNWSDRIYLSTNPVFNAAGAINMGNWFRNGALLVNGSYSVTKKIKLPANVQNTYYVHLVTDVYDQVFEFNNNENNTATSLGVNVILRPTPNLIVSNITIPYDTVSSNQAINVQWTDKNTGALTAAQPWVDDVYISNDTIFNINQDIRLLTNQQNNALLSLSSVSLQQQVTIPQYLPEGKYYFFARTDIYNAVNEYPNEGDNLSVYSNPVQIVLPDLTVSSVQSPATAISEQNYTVTYKVKNVGKAGLFDRNWSDRVILSPDTLLNSNDIILGTVNNNFILQRGNEYAKQVQITIPQGISGNYYLLVATDIAGNINESNNNNNLQYRAVSISLTPWPDLVVSNVSGPATDTAGTMLQFNYTVANAGSGAIVNKQWYDQFFLSPNNSLNSANNIPIGSVYQNRSLVSTAPYTQQASVQLPVSIVPGTYYIVVASDVNNNVFENTGENNNRGISDAIAINPMPNIDLAVISGSTSPSAVSSGQAVQVLYTIKNVGNYTSLPANWTDAVYLSANQAFDGGDRLLNSWTVNATLQVGDTVRYTRTVVIPNDVNGTFYLLAVTDRDNTQNDNNRANNAKPLNTVSGGSGGGGIIVTLPTPVDLQPISIITPAEGFAGQPMWVKYTIRNNGPGTTFAPYWRDAVFLTTNPAAFSGFSETFKNFTDSLVANASYTDSMQVFLTNNLSGNYIVKLGADYYANQYEHNAENNNYVSSPIIVRPQLPCDLKVTSITVPTTTQIAGQIICTMADKTLPMALCGKPFTFQPIPCLMLLPIY
jgi:archaellum component FlaG (FlaF/FlaG flagellin family)